MTKPINEKDTLEDSEHITFADFDAVNSKDLSVVLTKMLKISGNPCAKKKLFSIETSPNTPTPVALSIAANAPILFERVYRKRTTAMRDKRYETCNTSRKIKEHHTIDTISTDEETNECDSFAEHKIPLGMWHDKNNQSRNVRKARRTRIHRCVLI